MLRPYKLALLAYGLFLCRDCSAARALAGARVGVCALAAHRKIPAMANAAIRLNFNQPADIHLDLFAEIAFHPAFLLDGLTNVVDFLFGQIANLLGVIHTGFRRQLFRALLPDAVDGSQANPQPLLNRKINACYTCHETCLLIFLSKLGIIPGAACASDWCKSRAPRLAGESPCTCRKSFLPMP